MSYPGTLIAFAPGTIIRSADVNSNNDALRNSLLTAVLKDVSAIVTVAHTFTVAQIFSAGITVTGASTITGALSGVTTLSLAGPITLTAAVSKIIPGATSFSHRNAADSADNLLLTDAGAMTLRNTVVLNKATDGDLLDLQLAAVTKVKLRTFTGTGRIDIDGAQVLRATRTGWATATGTATRTTFDTATVTLPLLAERMKALIDDLHITAGHGLIGT